MRWYRTSIITKYNNELSKTISENAIQILRIQKRGKEAVASWPPG